MLATSQNAPAPLGEDDGYSRRLIQVVYRSRSLTDEAGERDILEASRRNNPAHDITGVLVAHAGWFMQVLEGPAGPVSDLLTRIENDRRNGGFLLVRATPVENRNFGEWAMASTMLDADRFIWMLDRFMSDPAQANDLLRRFVMDGRWRDSPLED